MARTARDARLEAFLALLEPGAAILELGRGGGLDAEATLAAGFDVTPTDGPPGLAAEAERRLGRPARVMLFEDLDAPAKPMTPHGPTPACRTLPPKPCRISLAASTGR